MYVPSLSYVLKSLTYRWMLKFKYIDNCECVSYGKFHPYVVLLIDTTYRCKPFLYWNLISSVARKNAPNNVYNLCAPRRSCMHPLHSPNGMLIKRHGLKSLGWEIESIFIIEIEPMSQQIGHYINFYVLSKAPHTIHNKGKSMIEFRVNYFY